MRASTGRVTKTNISDNTKTGTTKNQTHTTTLPEPGLVELQRLLSEHLATTVSVTSTLGRGRVSIDFADYDDLERIYRAMTEGSPNTD